MKTLAQVVAIGETRRRRRMSKVQRRALANLLVLQKRYLKAEEKGEPMEEAAAQKKMRAAAEACLRLDALRAYDIKGVHY